MRICNSKLTEDIIVANEEAHELKEALEAKKCRIPEY